jgi:hypothetical protein
MSIDEYEHAAMIPVSTCVAKQSRGNQAVLVDCNGSAEDQSASAHSRPVQFAFFRYRPVAVSTLEHHRRGGASSSNEKLAIRTHSQHSPLSEEQHLRQHDPPLHPDLKSASELIFDLRTKHLSSADPQQSPLMRRVVWDANPHLLATRLDRARPEKPLSATPSPDDGTTVVDVQAMKLRRIQTHPYLAEAKDGIWTDPQTNLQFFTDLCKYLGRNCNEQGRHTLTGMGIYRKGYVIKVYGIAYYVSKRDVVADPSMEQFATLTAEQLRARPDFYEKLRKLGHFDRTILLKTNMQLSAETMRSSLQADWSYLTEEAKSTLVGVSMNARPADDAMLALIQSPDNPSRCSCSQTAPPEYNANPDCCARGTELAFTWTKFNDLEVRSYELTELLDLFLFDFGTYICLRLRRTFAWWLRFA